MHFPSVANNKSQNLLSSVSRVCSFLLLAQVQTTKGPKQTSLHNSIEFQTGLEQRHKKPLLATVTNRHALTFTAFYTPSDISLERKKLTRATFTASTFTLSNKLSGKKRKGCFPFIDGLGNNSRFQRLVFPISCDLLIILVQNVTIFF